MLSSRIGSFNGLSVVDLYAGSGALGIEALSRGAASCHFVESERGATEALRANLTALQALDRATIAQIRVESFAPPQMFQLLFADPPYASGSGNKVVGLAAAGAFLAPGGWAAIETERGEAVDPGPYALEVERDIGRARVTLLRAP